MALRRFPPTTRKAEADRGSMGNDRTLDSTYTTKVMTPPSHNLPGRDSVRQLDETTGKSPLTDTLALGVAEKSIVTTPNYIYYRIYAEDGAIPSKTPIAPGDPFLGRIKVGSVPPPRTAQTVKRSISKVENIKDRTSTTLFLTPYSRSPMDDAEKVTILNGTGPGSTPQEPLALVGKMSDSERSALEYDWRRGRVAISRSADPDTEPLDLEVQIKYLYYLLYADDYEMPSKVGIDPGQPSLGRIRTDSVSPPRSLTSIKRCISRVEGIPSLVYADLYADTSCDTPLNEGHISTLRTDGPGLSPNEPMAIVQVDYPSISIPDGKYAIKNRAKDIYWSAGHNPIQSVYFCRIGYSMVYVRTKNLQFMQWDITQDADGNISMTSPYAPSSWVGAAVGAKIKGSTVPVPWRLIRAYSKFYYLTTDMNRHSQNPRVPTAKENDTNNPGSMAPLKEGDQWQMWEFIRI